MDKWHRASFNLSAGSHTYSVRQSDVAGNTSEASAAQTLVLDRVAPTVVTVNYISGSIQSGWERRLITFSEPILGFDRSDFLLLNSAGAYFTWPVQPIITDTGDHLNDYVDICGSGLQNILEGSAVFEIVLRGVQDVTGNKGGASYTFSIFHNDPLVFDFTGYGVETIDLTSSVNFDVVDIWFRQS